MTRLLDRLLLALFLALSSGYPPRFRREFSTVLREGIAHRIRIELRRGGRAPRARAAVVLGRDWVETMVREWSVVLAGRGFGDRSEPEDDRRGREGRMRVWIEELGQIVRMFLRRPSFGLTVSTVLGCGIAATTLVGAIVYGVVLRPMPYAQPDALVAVWQGDPEGDDRQNVAPGVLSDIEGTRSVFEAATGMVFFSNGISHRIADRMLPATARQVLPDFFDFFGVQPLLGRGFTEADGEVGAAAVVILSHDIWLRHYDADPSVIGDLVEIRGGRAEVVGVLPRAFGIPGVDADFWVPLVWDPSIHFSMDATQRRVGNLTVFARLRDGVSVDQAGVEVSGLASRIAAEWDDAPDDLRLSVQPLADYSTGPIRSTLALLLAAVTGLLVLACSNVTTLYVSRGLSHRSGLCVRAALGASRASLVRRVAIETSMYAALGGAIGLGAAAFAFPFFLANVPFPVPRQNELSVDFSLLLVGGVATTLCALMTAVVPCLQARSAVGKESLGADGFRVAGGPKRLRTFLVSAEVAVTLVLLVSSGLLLRSFENVRNIDTGLDPENLLTMSIGTPARTTGEADALWTSYVELFASLDALPGVESVSTVSRIPVQASSVATTLEAEGLPVPEAERPPIEFRRASPGHLSMSGVRILEGRDFNADDRSDVVPVMIVNRAAATLLVGSDPLVGRRVLWGGDARYHLVVGVVDDVHQFGLDGAAPPTMYLSTSQHPSTSAVLLVRTTDMAQTNSIEAVVRGWNPDLALEGGVWMESIVDEVLGPRRYTAGASSVFALAAVILAVMGIYGVFSQWTFERTHELGIRMALGSSAVGALQLIAQSGLRVVGVGLLMGLAASIGLTRAMESLLFGVPRLDPATYFGATVVLGTVAILACLIAARGVLQVDPARTLGSD